jgi:hypothetical protein
MHYQLQLQHKKSTVSFSFGAWQKQRKRKKPQQQPVMKNLSYLLPTMMALPPRVYKTL